ncbi:MAG: hypothetical protein WCD76_04210 [Pyrinomonadaceae bacterium]
MSDWIIFVVGAFVTFLLAGGLFYTVVEFQRMEKEPDRYKPGKYGWSEPHRERAGNKLKGAA